MAAFPMRLLTAASLVALAACATDTIPPSTAPVLAPGTPVVTTAPVVTAPVVTTSPVIATPPVAAVPVYPVVPGSGTSIPLVAPARLTASEITGLVMGNTITGVANNGATYHAWFSQNGQLRFRQGNFVDAGTWRIGPDGRFCTAMTRINGGIEECYYLYRTSTPTAVRFDRLDGSTAGTFSVLPGNTQAL